MLESKKKKKKKGFANKTRKTPLKGKKPKKGVGVCFFPICGALWGGEALSKNFCMLEQKKKKKKKGFVNKICERIFKVAPYAVPQSTRFLCICIHFHCSPGQVFDVDPFIVRRP